jgi:hypothetical protein
LKAKPDLWRVLGLATVLAVVLYLVALIRVAESSIAAPSEAAEQGAFLVAASLLTFLAAAGLAALRRTFRSPAPLIALCISGSLILTAIGILGAAAIGREADEGRWLVSWRHLLMGAVHGYWPTAAVFLAVALYVLAERNARAQVEPLALVPIFAWGANSTANHWYTFASSGEMTVFLQFCWHGALVAAGVFAVLVLSIGAAHAWLRQWQISIRFLTAVGFTALSVFGDWSLSLLAASLCLMDELAAA